MLTHTNKIGITIMLHIYTVLMQCSQYFSLEGVCDVASCHRDRERERESGYYMMTVLHSIALQAALIAVGGIVVTVTAIVSIVIVYCCSCHRKHRGKLKL